MSGYNKMAGMAAYEGALAAMRSVNAMGGVRGHKMHIVMVDSAGQPGRMLDGASRLVSEENVLFIIGPSNRFFVKTLAGFCASRKRPLFITSGNMSVIKRRGVSYADWVFRTTVDLSSSFRSLFRRFRKKGITGIGILVCDTGAGKRAMLLARGYASEYGLMVRGVQKFELGDADAMLQFRELKRAGSDLVLIIGHSGSMPMLAESAMFASMPIAMSADMLNTSFMEDIPSSLELWTAFPPVAAGKFLTSSHPCAFAVQRFYINMPPDFVARSIVEKMAAGAAWDAVQLATLGIGHLKGKVSPLTLKKSLEELETCYTGVMGVFEPDKRDHAGLEPGSLVVLRTSNGKWIRP